MLGSWSQHLCSVSSGRDQEVANRPIQTVTAGLDAELTQDSHGDWTIALADDEGTEVYRKAGYANQRSAKSGAYQWARKHYQVEAEEPETWTEIPVPEAPKGKSLGPTSATLPSLMRARAAHNEQQVITLRTQAAELEMEAKRLREAADTLEGPDGPA